MRSGTEKTAYDCPGWIAEDQIRSDAVAAITLSPAKVTPSALTQILSEKYRLPRKQIKTVIRKLVGDGELAYTYQYGSTYLELAFNRPRRVSQYIVLHPPGSACHLGPADVVVQIQPGASFGDGRHPTTRLALRGIEMVLRRSCTGVNFSRAEILDIGCGSGVLVIAAVRLGAAGGLGLDLDPCALEEARHNVRLNSLAHRIEISSEPLETIRRRFKLVTANLRYPSLAQLRSRLCSLTASDGVLVISGIRNSELNDLLQSYAEQQWICRWRQTEAGWAGAVLQRTDSGNR